MADTQSCVGYKLSAGFRTREWRSGHLSGKSHRWTANLCLNDVLLDVKSLLMPFQFAGRCLLSGMLKTSVNSFFWWRKRFWEVNKSYTTNTLEGLGVVHNNLGGGGGGCSHF